LKEIKPEQHFTQPPPRYTDASLIKDLEEKGIGRPSTYAAIISTLIDKKYAEKDQSGRFSPSELGRLVTELLQENFEQIMDVAFTAQMEDRLDEIEDGEKSWVQVLSAFYEPFKITLDQAKEKMLKPTTSITWVDVACDMLENFFSKNSVLV
jgi:DNA topoisomerase-1